MRPMFRTIRWRIALPFVILILAIMGSLTVYLSARVRAVQLAELQTQLAASARLLAYEAGPLLTDGTDPVTIEQMANRWGELIGARVTLIAADGRVLGDSVANPVEMENHLSRVEVQQALQSGEGSSIRFSETVQEQSLYVSVPILPNGVTEGSAALGVLRLSLPLRQVEANVASLQRTILSATFLAALLAIILSIVIAERTAQPVRRLTHVVQRVAGGDLRARLLPTSRDEIGELTRAFNHMSEQLRQQMSSLAENSSRLSTVLEQLADGVLMTDETGRVHVVNPAALRLLETTEPAVIGRSFAEVVRHHRLIRLWQQARERGEEQIAAIELDGPGQFWQLIVTPFRDGDRLSYLVIIQDLTQLRRLETARRDFISNISHELRNPLASIKAVVETLQDGALDDPPVAHRFLERAEVEIDAMTQMIQELLELSRIESGRVPLRLQPTAIEAIIESALARLQAQAERAGVQLSLFVKPDLPPVLADGDRVEQVVVNLVHNAIKFTPSGGAVEIRARRHGDADPPEILIEVRDTGVGIPSEDLPRIFERFYKADRARSGGGTGLGLAIAKHIVQAHGGRIWAQSREGRGSSFYFALPVAT